jgi:hypothetical protein
MAAFRTLSTNERAESPGYTNICVVTSEDLTSATVTTVQTITVATFNAGDQMMRVAWRLRAPFQNTADATNNTTLISVGDTAAVTTHLTTAETNLNGAFVTWRTGNTLVLYTANDILTVSFTPKTATAPSVINRGELHILFGISRLKAISDGVASPRYNKP